MLSRPPGISRTRLWQVSSITYVLDQAVHLLGLKSGLVFSDRGGELITAAGPAVEASWKHMIHPVQWKNLRQQIPLQLA